MVQKDLSTDFKEEKDLVRRKKMTDKEIDRTNTRRNSIYQM